MNRCRRPAMAARKGDQVLLCAFRRAQPVTKGRDRALFEGDHLGHAAILIATRLIIRPIRADFSQILACGRAPHGHAQIFCPVASQSLRKAAMPLSVSGCLNSWRITAAGAVMTSAPSLADSRMWMGLRTLA